MLDHKVKEKIHSLFVEAMIQDIKGRGRFICFENIELNHNSNFGDAVQAILAREISPAKIVNEKIIDLEKDLTKLKGKLSLFEKELNYIYQMVSDASRSPVFRNLGSEKEFINAPITALDPISEINMILRGVRLAKQKYEKQKDGKHPIYHELAAFWVLVTNDYKKMSRNTKMVQMISLATDADPESVSRYLQRTSKASKG